MLFIYIKGKGKTMDNKEIIKNGIKDSFIIKTREGEEPQTVLENLALQIYKFISKEPNFTSKNVSRGMRNLFTEQNREAITLALGNLYIEYIDTNNSFNNKYDNYVKSIRESSDKIDKLMNTIFSNKEMIYRMGRVAVESSLNELIKAQSKTGNYMRKTAQQSTPVNNAEIVNALNAAQTLIRNMQDYSAQFGYNDISDIATLQSDISMRAGDKPKNRIYSGDGMTGILNIGKVQGKYKKTQEDAILMLSHPKNKNFKIAVVADGMGGPGNGDAASYIATNEANRWFKQLPEQFYNSDAVKLKYQNGSTVDITFEDTIKKLIIDINDKIVKYVGDKPGTTFSAAIIRNRNGKDTVTSISIGDSKILKISENGQIQQLSKDDNILSERIRSGSLYVEDSNPNFIYTSNPKHESLDVIYKPKRNIQGIHNLKESDIRFHRKNNIITDCLGCGQTRTTING